MKNPGVNLIPAAVRARHVRQWRMRVWLGLWACTVIGQVVIGTFLYHEARQVKHASAQAGELRRVTKVALQNNQSLTARREEATEQIARLDRLAAKHRWSRLLDWLAEYCPEQVYLTQLQVADTTSRLGQGPRRPQRSQAADSLKDLPMPHNLVLTGYAADHPGLLKFISLLKDSDAFGSVSLLQTKRESLGSGEAVGFTLLCQW